MVHFPDFKQEPSEKSNDDSSVLTDDEGTAVSNAEVTESMQKGFVGVLLAYSELSDAFLRMKTRRKPRLQLRTLEVAMLRPRPHRQMAVQSTLKIAL